MPSVIVANGDIGEERTAAGWLENADRLIAADGGLQHCLRLGFNPDLLVGDLDSVSADEREQAKQAGTEILQHPRRKDATDLELALQEAAARGASEVVVLGAIGSRWDQSIVNLLLAANADLESVRVRFIAGPQQAELLRGGARLELEGEAGDTVSLIPLKGTARGISTSGLAYRLQDGTLQHGSSRGISNYIESPPASVKLDEGLLLCLTIRGGAAAVEPEDG